MENGVIDFLGEDGMLVRQVQEEWKEVRSEMGQRHTIVKGRDVGKLG